MENKYAYEYIKKRLAAATDGTANSIILKRMLSQINFDPFFSGLISDEKLSQESDRLKVDFILDGFIENYLNPSFKFLNDPFLMSDMDKAVARISAAITSGESICIYGDYDVDGITSTSFLVSFLRELVKRVKHGGTGAHIFYKLPDRIKDGYGLGKEPIDEIIAHVKNNAEKPLTLLITVDLGITNAEETAYANSRDVDVIICDHHEVPSVENNEILPPALAVLNPKRKNDGFPFKFLPGVGIAFNLGIALRKHMVEKGLLSSYPNLKDYLDIVCLGIIADIVPMYGDNRTLTYHGLKILKDSRRPGIRELKRICGLHFNIISESDVAWKIAPKINAAGRVGNPAVAVELLTQDDSRVAYELGQELESMNRKRQALEDACFNEALAVIEEKRKSVNSKMPIVIIKGDSWHPGVIGIVSSKLAEFMQKPVLIMTGYKTDVYIGSARSCGDIDIYAFLKQYETFFTKFGGHKMACGLTVRKGKDTESFISSVVDDFSNKSEKPAISASKNDPQNSNGDNIAENFSDTDEEARDIPYYDEEIGLSLIDEGELAEAIKRMSPYGPLNEQPRFLARNVTLSDINKREFKNKGSKKSNFTNCYFTLNIKDADMNKKGMYKAMMFNRHQSLENILKFNSSEDSDGNGNNPKTDVDGIVFEFYNGLIKIINLI